MMKNNYLLFIFIAGILLSGRIYAQGVAISDDNSSPDPSAILDVKSSDKGFLMPRMTGEEVTSIDNPANGMIVFCTSDEKFYAYISAENIWKEIAFAPPPPKQSCLEWLNAGYTTNGVYTIDPDGAGGLDPFDCYCDMTTDGGGWTLVAHAGPITINKAITTGQSNAYWQPLLFSWGIYDADALNTHSSFSRFDLVKNLATESDEFMVRTESYPDNIVIFPVLHVEWFGRDPGEGHFTITDANNDLPYLKLSNTGNGGIVTRTTNVCWNYIGSDNGNYPGINWNVGDGSENCDYCGRNFSTALNHRSILYWETNDFSYSATQWFHSSPMTLAESTGPQNNLYNIAFYWR